MNFIEKAFKLSLISDDKTHNLSKSVEDVLKYVNVLQKVDVSNNFDIGKKVNVFREDEITNDRGYFKKDFLSNAPKTKNNYISVKKVL